MDCVFDFQMSKHHVSAYHQRLDLSKNYAWAIWFSIILHDKHYLNQVYTNSYFVSMLIPIIGSWAWLKGNKNNPKLYGMDSCFLWFLLYYNFFFLFFLPFPIFRFQTAVKCEREIMDENVKGGDNNLKHSPHAYTSSC